MSESHAPLSIVLEADGLTVTTAAGDVVLRQHAEQDHRPFIHPLVAPGGGVVTEDAPSHHPWQHGLYIGLNDVNGIGFWSEGLHPKQHHDGTFDSRLVGAPSVDGEGAAWQVSTDYRDLDRTVMLEDDQLWKLAVGEGRLLLDLTWTLHARRDLVFGEYEYGGLFLRMPFRRDAGGSALDSEGQSESGHTARWVAVTMPLPETGREAQVAVLDHPDNPGSPVPWRIDNELGIGPSPSVAGAWTLADGQQTVFRYRIVVFAEPVTGAVVDAEWNTYERASR